MRKGVNLEVLKKPQRPAFLDELDSAPSNIILSQAKSFFNLTISSLNTELPNNVLKNILKTIAIIIQDEKFLNIFISGGYTSALPFENEILQKSLFDFLYVLISLDINALDSEFANSFSETMLPKDPSKTLTLLGLYSQSFNDADDPWPILDLLFLNSEPFEHIEFVQDYLSLLVYLVKSYPTYRRERGKHVWKKLIQMTTKDDISIIRYSYFCLTEIATIIENQKVNSSLIKKHLKIDDIQQSVLSFLLVVKTNLEYFRNQHLLSILINIAQRDLKATLILMILSADTEIAKLMLDIEGWMLKKLPSTIDTFRLILVLFQHKSIRKRLSNSEEFPLFLQSVSKTKNTGILSTICTMVRRLTISKELVGRLSESGFIETFNAACESSENESALHSELLLTDRLLEGGFSQEFLDVCDTVAMILSTPKSPLIEPAAFLAVNLAIHKRCRKRLINRGVDQFFEVNSSGGPLKKVSRQFLKIINEE